MFIKMNDNKNGRFDINELLNYSPINPSFSDYGIWCISKIDNVYVFYYKSEKDRNKQLKILDQLLLLKEE